MKPPPPKLSDLATPSPGETQTIDLHDVELSVAAVSAAHAAEAAGERRTAPPPLPPEAFVSVAPGTSAAPGRTSQQPPSHAPSHAPSVSPGAGGPGTPSLAPAPPAPPKSTAFYALAILVCLVVGVGVGVGVAMSSLRKAPPASASAKPGSAVITIPTVEVDDDPDGGR